MAALDESDERALGGCNFKELIDRVKASGGSEMANCQPFIERLCYALSLPQPDFAAEQNRFNDYVYKRRVDFKHADGSTTPGRMSEEHLDFLSQRHRDVILAGFGDVAGDPAGIFMFFTGDGTEVHVGAALFFRWPSPRSWCASGRKNRRRAQAQPSLGRPPIFAETR